MAGMSTGYIAIDLGAESGRVIVGVFEGERLRLEEVHRFQHEPVWLPTGLHWNITGIWREIVAGLRRAAEWAKANGVELVSVGVDTWGVDWALVDKAGELVGLPHAYRDPRNTAAYERSRRQTRPRPNLPDDRHPVHGAQHAVFALRAQAGRSRTHLPRPISCSSFRICSTTG